MIRTTTVVFSLALAGCATMQNVRSASELLGCSEDAITEVARPAASGRGLYSGCGGTVACLESGSCFLAHRAADVVPLPGLTRYETMVHATLVNALRETVGEERGSPGVCSAGFSGGGGMSNPGPFAVILLPVLAVVAAVAIGCAASNAEQADRVQRRDELRRNIRELEDRVHPLSPSGCTPEERRRLDLGLAMRLTASVCRPPVAASVTLEPPDDAEELEEAPAPPEPPPGVLRAPLRVPPRAQTSTQAHPRAQPSEPPAAAAPAEGRAGDARVLDNALRGRR
jgi:hypothetical protein